MRFGTGNCNECILKDVLSLRLELLNLINHAQFINTQKDVTESNQNRKESE
jgi:hypothetical protein